MNSYDENVLSAIRTLPNAGVGGRLSQEDLAVALGESDSERLDESLARLVAAGSIEALMQPLEAARFPVFKLLR
jgi:hypothetical protein